MYDEGDLTSSWNENWRGGRRDHCSQVYCPVYQLFHACTIGLLKSPLKKKKSQTQNQKENGDQNKGFPKGEGGADLLQ